LKSFKDALWDGSDPTYAPGLSWSRLSPWWKCPKRYIEAGYNIKSVALDGTKGDGNDAARALRCRELTQELLLWWSGEDKSAPDYGTWKWLMARYISDQYSPIKDVKANTRDNYLWLLGRWEDAIGHMQISDMNYVRIKQIQEAMKTNGRSVSYIKRMFTMLRTVSHYGIAIESEPAAKVSMVLSKVRFQNAPQRQSAPTRKEIYSIVEQADLAGARSFSLCVLIQFEFILRGVDVRGQWLATDEREGGIIRNGKRWQDGLTWDMVTSDVSSFEKVISKTSKSLPEALVFDLSAIPDIRDRMMQTPPEKRVGPVIISEKHGMPYTKWGMSQAWAKFRTLAGVSKDVWLMDARAAGISEAKALGAQPYDLRDAAQHASVTTTDRYARGRSSNVSKVVNLRNAKN
jgi:hypothetical protein